jgi:hypothetical protein
MRPRKRIDWDEEEAKTSKARIKGLRYTFVSLLAAFGVTGMLKIRHPQLDLYPALSVMGALLAGAVLLILLTRKR